MGARSLTRDELTGAAKRVLETGGLDTFTMDRIAGEAGISRVTLHRRGITKESLLDELGDQVLAEYRDALWPALVSDAPAEERLRAALEGLCRVAEDHLALLQALGSASGRIAAEGEALFHEPGEDARTRELWTEPLIRILRDGQREGRLREGDPVETATLLFNMVGWTYIHLRAGHRWRAERARESTIDVALNGVIGADAGP